MRRLDDGGSDSVQPNERRRVAPPRLQVCVEVLRRVHREAVARDAGILFLGDFWHVRGALPVEPLNAALHEMRAWTQPTVMLPGNHDQVSGGPCQCPSLCAVLGTRVA